MGISRRNVYFVLIASFFLLLIYKFDTLVFLASNRNAENISLIDVSALPLGGLGLNVRKSVLKSGFPYLERIMFYHNTLDVDYFHTQDFQNEPPSDDQLSPFKELLKSRIIRAERSYPQNIAERKRFLMTESKEVNIHGANEFENVFKSTFDCPHLKEEVGSGTAGGGMTGEGKWICGFQLYKSHPRPQECVVYTFGLSFQNDFEGEWLTDTDCKVLKFQFKNENRMLESNILKQLEMYPDLYIGRKLEHGSESLREIMSINEHGWLDVLVLNIEEEVHDVLDNIMKEFNVQVLPFAQLIVRFPVDKNEKKFSDIFISLEDAGMRPFHSKRSSSDREEIEYSFLNLRGKHLLLVGDEQ